ncbi:hypothetical protein ACFSCX_13785 [Bacillus salitolerans]|uniref:Uncharacterized protein n=1 Tax=Bacillus salitolerans TaxID=1437434 RepID=A0ABW4LRX7_9BACI
MGVGKMLIIALFAGIYGLIFSKYEEELGLNVITESILIGLLTGITAYTLIKFNNKK